MDHVVVSIDLEFHYKDKPAKSKAKHTRKIPVVLECTSNVPQLVNSLGNLATSLGTLANKVSKQKQLANSQTIRNVLLRSPDGRIVLAVGIDGRYGIVNAQNQWLHKGSGEYIASVWKRYTGHYPVLNHSIRRW
jgi:hypothetical protein